MTLDATSRRMLETCTRGGWTIEQFAHCYGGYTGKRQPAARGNGSGSAFEPDIALPFEPIIRTPQQRAQLAAIARTPTCPLPPAPGTGKSRARRMRRELISAALSAAACGATAYAAAAFSGAAAMMMAVTSCAQLWAVGRALGAAGKIRKADRALEGAR